MGDSDRKLRHFQRSELLCWGESGKRDGHLLSLSGHWAVEGPGLKTIAFIVVFSGIETRRLEIGTNNADGPS